MECELCGRKGVSSTVHHLTPKEEGGTFGPTANLCPACHKQIHALYTNQELAIRLNTIKKLKEDDQIRRFLKWIKKQPSTKRVKVSKSNEKNRKK
ncbi:HNH endonuclease [Alkalihalobacillus sp. CinArs1]|uniref:HNH endonuclease n=1 Tax=Alkalihalobacillus sp. CinArs1 TaxID=2995314 RepID=UPI0022DD4AAF|nr:HNH endonuclease [Alkalihalobacillus sp. CinArs1]